MKIVSQAMNVTTGETGNSVNADASKGSFQSSFSSVIGATVEAARQNGDAKFFKAQNVDTKKTSSLENKKKITASSADGAPVASQSPSNSVQIKFTMPLAPQVVIPQGLPAQVVKPAVLASQAPSDATVESKPALVEAISQSGVRGTSDFTRTSLAQAATEVSPSSVAAPVSLPVAAETHAVSLAADPGSVGTAIEASAGLAIDVASELSTTGTAGVINGTGVDTASLPGFKSVEVADRGAQVARLAPPASGAAYPNSDGNARLTTSVVPAVTASEEPGKNNALPQRVTTSNFTDSSKSHAASGELLTKQSVATDNTAAPTVPVQTLARGKQTDVTALPAQTSASQMVGSQMSVPQNSAVQRADASFSTVSAGGFGLSVVKPASSGVVAVGPPSIEKGRTSNSDLRSNRSAASPDEDASSDGTETKVEASPVASPTINSGQAVSHGKGVIETVALTQNAQAAQGSGQASATPASSVAAPVTASAVSTALPAQPSFSQMIGLQMSVPQMSAVQHADVSSSTVSAGGFGLSVVKPATSGVVAVGSPNIGKGRTSNSDLRSNRSAASPDEDASSDGTERKVEASPVASPTINSGQAVSHVKGALETAALTQNAQAAQGSGQASATPASSVAAPLTASAVSTALPAQMNSIESAPVTHALNSAQLIQSVHGSEMRLGMQSAEFGNISINTTISREMLSAQISMDHSALGHALAMHLPAIEEKLGSAYGVQAKVELRDTGSNSASNDSGSSESRNDRRPSGGHTGTSTSMLQSSIGSMTSSSFASSSTPVAAASSRLDIRI